MNQNDTLDTVARLLLTEAAKGEGTLLLIYDTDYKVIRIDLSLSPSAAIIEVFDAAALQKGLQPSHWLALSKKLWANVITKGKTIKLKTRRQLAGPPQPEHEGA